MPSGGSTESPVKAASPPQAGRSEATSLDRAEASPKIESVMARLAVCRCGHVVILSYGPVDAAHGCVRERRIRVPSPDGLLGVLRSRPDDALCVFRSGAVESA